MDKSPASTTSSTPPARTTIKKEAPEEEIKDYAETAMNELLGWYGYERLEMRRWAAAARDAPTPDSASNKEKDECSWCNNAITTDSALHQSGAQFCSELCFSQSRRANFKRAKTCDWCRHIRHTVAYVDFQDGATQLQFCSDKCLNQYKMHIFCRETQAHLDQNPHLAGSTSTSNLITPELWLKNCRSRSASPDSETLRSPNPVEPPPEKPPEPMSLEKKSPHPMITVAPTSKLLKKCSVEERDLICSPEHKKELRTTKLTARRRRASRCSATVTSQSLKRQYHATPKTQDHMCSPPSTVDASSPTSSTAGAGVMQSPPPIKPHIPSAHPNFPDYMLGNAPAAAMFDGMRPEHRLRMGHQPNFIPRPDIMFEGPRLPPPPMPFVGLGQPPPVTIFIPYPIPIPLPIPVPIPLPAMLQAYMRRPTTGTSTKSSEDDGNEGPLDFTMSEKNREENKEHERKENVNDENAQPIPEDKNEIEENPEQTLPRFKITRLGTKTPKIVPKPRELPESTRPLRKRKRLIHSEVNSDEECSPLIPKSRKIVQV